MFLIMIAGLIAAWPASVLLRLDWWIAVAVAILLAVAGGLARKRFYGLTALIFGSLLMFDICVVMIIIFFSFFAGGMLLI